MKTLLLTVFALLCAEATLGFLEFPNPFKTDSKSSEIEKLKISRDKLRLLIKDSVGRLKEDENCEHLEEDLDHLQTLNAKLKDIESKIKEFQSQEENTEERDAKSVKDEETETVVDETSTSTDIKEVDNADSHSEDGPKTDASINKEISSFFMENDNKKYGFPMDYLLRMGETKDEETSSEKEEDTSGCKWENMDDCRNILNESKVGRALVASLICAAMAALTAVATVKLIMSVLGLMGFGSLGVAGSSFAAFVQAKIGTIAAGSWFAMLQAAGMTGLVYTGPVGIFSGLGVAGICVAYYMVQTEGTYYNEFVTDLCEFSEDHCSVYNVILRMK